MIALYAILPKAESPTTETSFTKFSAEEKVLKNPDKNTFKKAYHSSTSPKKMYYVYLLTNNDKNVLYTGVTNDLLNRITEHYLNRGSKKTFTGRYACFNLLYYEEFENVRSAIEREKEIKGWSRKKKDQLIKIENPDLVFLNSTLFDSWPPVEFCEKNVSFIK